MKMIQNKTFKKKCLYNLKIILKKVTAKNHSAFIERRTIICLKVDKNLLVKFLRY